MRFKLKIIKKGRKDLKGSASRNMKCRKGGNMKNLEMEFIFGGEGNRLSL